MTLKTLNTIQRARVVHEGEEYVRLYDDILDLEPRWSHDDRTLGRQQPVPKELAKLLEFKFQELYYDDEEVIG